MKHRAFTLIEAIVVLMIIAIGAAILLPVFARPKDGHGDRNRCPSNLKQIGLGFAQYIQDYDEKYPPTQNAIGGWVELTQPYLKSWRIFHCPTDDAGNTNKTTDYYYNARLTGVEANKLDAFSTTILVGEGDGDCVPSYGLSQLPAAWRKDQGSPAWRHLDGANYAFADGHVKWFKPEKITLDKPAKMNPTFLLGGSHL